MSSAFKALTPGQRVYVGLDLVGAPADGSAAAVGRAQNHRLGELLTLDEAVDAGPRQDKDGLQVFDGQQFVASWIRMGHLIALPSEAWKLRRS
jgi:hypothetical protein